MDKWAEGGLKSMGKTEPVREISLEHREQLHKIQLNLKLFYATEPRAYYQN